MPTTIPAHWTARYTALAAAYNTLLDVRCDDEDGCLLLDRVLHRLEMAMHADRDATA